MRDYYRRGKKGTIYVRIDGVRTSTGTTDPERAKWFKKKHENEAWDRANGRSVPTWDGACIAWAKGNPLSAVGVANLRFENWWKDHLSGKSLRAITPELVNDLVTKHRTGVSATERLPANATANAYVQFVARVIAATSSLRPAFIHYPPMKGRLRWLTPAEWFLLAAKMDGDLRDVCEFSLATGLRQANCLEFDWAWLHGDWALIPPEFTKTDEPYGIPLNKTAQAVIARRKAAAVRHPNLAFLNAGKPWYRVAVARKLWKALEDSGVDEITYHGFRHTFTSWLAQKGVSESIRARLGCWRTGRMADRYSHFDVESLRPFAAHIDEALKTAQAEKRRKESAA